MIDTHAHLTDRRFENDLDTVIDRAFANGVSCIITIGSDLEDTGRARNVAESYPAIHYTCGIHPHAASRESSTSIEHLREFCSGAVAVGEIGLDYHYNFSSKEDQKTVMLQQCLLSRQMDRPVVIHCREAYPDLFQILDTVGDGLRGVVHSFSGDLDQASRLIRQGYFLSFNGILTFKKSIETQAVFQALPPDSILLETDCPYLAPEPCRGKRNEPALIARIYEHAASLWNLSVDDVIRINRTNTRRVFGIGPGFQSHAVVYAIRDTLYVNLTNRCLNRCIFCVANQSDFYMGHHLRLKEEPTIAAVLKQIGDPSRFREIVFCGYGEPLMRWETVCSIGRILKNRARKIRINTSGHFISNASLEGVVQSISSAVDAIEISIGNSSAAGYANVCRPVSNADADSFRVLHDFIALCRRQESLEVALSCVDHPDVDIQGCSDIARAAGLPLKIRKFLDFGPGYRSRSS